MKYFVEYFENLFLRCIFFCFFKHLFLEFQWAFKPISHIKVLNKRFKVLNHVSDEIFLKFNHCFFILFVKNWHFFGITFVKRIAAFDTFFCLIYHNLLMKVIHILYFLHCSVLWFFDFDLKIFYLLFVVNFIVYFLLL